MVIEGEECKFIEGTDEFYAVSVTGKVWSWKNWGSAGARKEKRIEPFLIKQNINTKNGRPFVLLRINGKRVLKLVNRLVAIAFIKNPENLPQVNHKNEDPLDNRVENLEWCTAEYNCNFGTRNKRIGESRSGFKHENYLFVCPIKLAYLKRVKKLSRKDLSAAFSVSPKLIGRKCRELGIK